MSSRAGTGRAHNLTPFAAAAAVIKAAAVSRETPDTGAFLFVRAARESLTSAMRQYGTLARSCTMTMLYGYDAGEVPYWSQCAVRMADRAAASAKRGHAGGRGHLGQRA